MQTSKTGILSKRGFSLLELTLVIFFLSLFMAITFPLLNPLESAYKSEAKKLASLIRYLNDSAINRKKTYAMTVDLGRKMIHWDSPDGHREADFGSLESFYVASKGKLKEGELKIFFGPLGFEESLKADFSKGDDILSVNYNPYSRKVKIEKNE